MIYIIAIVVLLCILFPQHAFKMIAVAALIAFANKPSTNAIGKCDEINVARQMNFPLCWMMSVVGLLNNLLTVHKVKFLHSDVVMFVKDWKNKLLTIDPKEASCPLINPPQLRKYIQKTYWQDAQDALEKVTVRVFKDSETMQRFLETNAHECLSSTEVEDSWSTWASDHVRTRKAGWEFSRWSALSASPQAHVFTNVPDITTITARYDDPVVMDYLVGKRWYFSHPVCVSKFVGFSAKNLLRNLLSYNGSIRFIMTGFEYEVAFEEITADMHLDNIQRELSQPRHAWDDLVLHELPASPYMTLFFIQNLNESSFVDTTGFKLLGGLFVFWSKERSHAMHFVTCGSSMVFVDSNDRNNQTISLWDFSVQYVRIFKTAMKQMTGQIFLIFQNTKTDFIAPMFDDFQLPVGVPAPTAPPTLLN